MRFLVKTFRLEDFFFAFFKFFSLPMELLTCFFFFWRRAKLAAGPAFLFPAACEAGRRAFDFDL